jgi:thiol:disulfide interchange protein DsbD
MRTFLKLLLLTATTACADDISARATLVRDGDKFRVTVVIKMAEHWHINANPTAEPGLIPTTVTWNIPVERTTYPPGKTYTGRVEIVSEGRAPAGQLRLDGTLRYQACNGDVCYPPKNIPLTVGTGPAATVAKRSSLWVMLFGAFIGGLLLNLMPCVLPVISLKILGFVQEGASRRLGLLYGAGVIVSFWVLAAAVIALKLAGRQVGWGFQFQDVRFVLAMALLCTVIALSLFGVFEFGVGSKTMETASRLAGRGAFFNGALAVLLATPCTAPFLAPALGLAFSQSSAVIFAALTSVALGLALPYVVLSWNERWLRWLPKPGPWLTSFKQFMGFPMLATALWLTGIAGVPHGALMWLLVSAFLIWLAATLRPGRFAWIIVAVALATGLGWWKLSPSKSLIEWRPYSKAGLAEALKTSQPVFVDFTADWCLTCQVNKRVAIETKAVAERFRELGVIPLLADWTQPNPEIAEALRAIGRSGVPAYRRSGTSRRWCCRRC